MAQLPELRVNALMDFSPANNALQNYQQTRVQNEKLGMEQDRLGMDRERLDMTRQQHAQQQEAQTVQRMGALANAVLQEKDPARQAMMMQGLHRAYPQMGQHLTRYGVDPNDHVTTAKFLAAEANLYDPMKQRMQEAQLAHMGTQEKMAQAQMAQLRQQTPEYRAKVAPQYGLQQGTPEYNQFVISGQYAPKQDTVTVKEGETIYQRQNTPDGPKLTPLTQGTPKPMKDYETKDAMWAERLHRSNAVIDKVAGIDATGAPAEKAYDPTRASNRFWPDDAWGANLVNSSQWQQYQQAAREGIAAILRKDTGAAVTQQEWELYFPMYYPQPGDSKETVLQKVQARQAAAHALQAASGEAYGRMFPGQAKPQMPAPPAPGNASAGWSVKRID